MRKENNRDEERELVRRTLGRWGNYREFRLELMHDISAAEDQIEAELDIKAAPLTGMPNGSMTSDKVARMAERYAEKKARLEDHIRYLREKLDEETRLFKVVDSAVNKLPIPEQRMLRFRFVRGYTMLQAASLMHYSLSGGEGVERRALDMLKPVIFKELLDLSEEEVAAGDLSEKDDDAGKE